MKRTRVVAIILIICGAALIGFSMYVTKEVEHGKSQVSSAQGKVDKGSGLFSGNPVAQEIGKGVTQGAQKKIDEGQAQINFYEGVASVTMIGGIACIVIGVGAYLFGGKKK